MHFINIDTFKYKPLNQISARRLSENNGVAVSHMTWHIYRLNDGILGILYFTALRLDFIFYGKVFTNTV